MLFLGAVALYAGWAAYQSDFVLPHFLRDDTAPTIAQLKETIARQEREIVELRARALRAEGQRPLGSASSDDLVREIKSLTEQNAALKEDLAFFQTLLPAGSGTSGIVVERFRVEKEALPGEYRYRLFLLQSGQRERDFQGRLQLVVNVVERGATRALVVPAESERDARDHQLKFRFFQRVEGTFRVHPDAAVKSVQLRVYEQGSKAPKLAQTVNVT